MSQWSRCVLSCRTCVGQSLGKMNVMATAAILFSHFTFSLAEEVGAQVQMLCCTCCPFAANSAACSMHTSCLPCVLWTVL